MRASVPVVPAVIAGAVLVLLVGAIGYGIGAQAGRGSSMSEVKVFRDATVSVGDGQASATIDGTTYGFHADVAWIDTGGGFHDHGWPTCLPNGGQAKVTFGGAMIFTPTTGYARILWVDCRPSP